MSMFSRIFWSFSIFIIILVNIILYFSYFLTQNFYINEVKKNIYSQYETIKTFIDINTQDIFSLPIGQVKQLNQVGFYFNIQKSNNPFISKFVLDKDIIYLQTFYNGYNIILGKKLLDLNLMKKNFLKASIYINLVSLFLIFIISYLVAKKSLKPFDDIIIFLKSYNLGEEKYIKNNYKNTDIGTIIDNINSFIKEINKSYKNQKELVQDISHEFKTPLMQISTSLELIENKIENKKILEKIQTIKSSIQNLSNLVKELNFLESNFHNLKKEKIKISDLLKELVKTYEDLALVKNIKISFENKANPEIYANKDLVKKLFSNLITNAILYNKKNGKIYIRTFENKVEIEDNGIGIENVDKVFNRFYKESKNSNSSGLGLSIVNKIIGFLNWKIEIKSKKGIGTKIIIFTNPLHHFVD